MSAKGEFLGGAIAPGVQVSSDAAAARSAALRRVELTRPRSVVGKNTVECMQAGAVFGFAGLVDGLVSRIREDIDGFGGGDVAVVATGHTAPLLLPNLHTVSDYDRHLTLDGLRLVFERNRDRRARQAETAPLEERADQVDDAVVVVQHRDHLPLVERGAGMRDPEPQPATHLDGGLLRRGRSSGMRADR